MYRKLLAILLLSCPCSIFAQEKLGPLTVEKIMRDPKWMGTSPSGPYWSEDGKYILFNWNPDGAVSDSVYYVTTTNLNPVKSTYTFRNSVIRANSVQLNSNKTSMVYADGGDIFMKDLKTGNKKKILQTNGTELNPQFAFNDTRVVYSSGSNLYSRDISTGQITQLTSFESGVGISSTGGPRATAGQGSNRSQPTDSRMTQDGYLKDDALENSSVLTLRKSRRELADSIRKSYPQEKKLRTINIEDKSVFGLNISPDGVL